MDNMTIIDIKIFLAVKEYNNQRVLTFKDIDGVHDKSNGTACSLFESNIENFIEGVDYYKLQKEEIYNLGFASLNGSNIVLTKSGYLTLAKSFTNNLDKQMQRELVDAYFKVW